MQRLRATLLLAALACAGRPATAQALGYKLAHVLQPPEVDGSFGDAIATDGAHVLVGSTGAHFDGLGSGAAYLFDTATGALLATYSSPTPEGFFFGDAVALSGDRVLVGEPYETVGADQPGAAWIFDTSGNLDFAIADPTPSASQYFGRPLVVDGGQLWIGSAYSRTYPSVGAVHLFDLATGNLIRTIPQPASIPDAGGFGIGFGIALAPLGGELAVGAPGEIPASNDRYGAAYVIDAATGAIRLRLVDPFPAPHRQFGSALAVAGATLAIGAPSQSGGLSAVHLFDPTTGALIRTLESPFHLQDSFGADLAADGSRLVTGALNFASRDPSAAFVFDTDTGALLATVMHPDLSAAQFGRAVALHGRDLFVGGKLGATPSSDGMGAVFHFIESCGDGVLDPCERCDDGNRTNGDGCDADCRLESCGNGVVDPGESCDDGNAIDGDGCDSNCLPTGCGDCIVTAGEECDDGNAVDGDGCDQGCVLTRCGNGIPTPREECDDGNDLQGDGCTRDCRREVCGNGVLDAGESCDDGNPLAGDGCGPDCHLETPRLEWLKAAFSFYVGDFNSYYGQQQIVVGPSALLVAVHYNDEDTHAFVFDRDGQSRGTFEQTYAGPIATFGADFLVGELARYGDDPTQRIHRYDGATLERRTTYFDPTPETPDRFGFVMAGIGTKVLARDDTDHAVYVFDADTGALEHTLRPPPPGDPAVFGTTVRALGDRALVAGAEAVHLFDLDTGMLVRTFTAPRRARGAFGGVFTAVDTDVLISGNGVVYRFDAASGDVRHVFTPPGGARDASFGADIVVAGTDVVIQGARGLYVFDATTQALRHVIPKPPARGPDSCFGRVLPAFDGHLVASDPCADIPYEDDDGIIYVFAHDDGRLLGEVHGAGGYEDYFTAKATYDTTIVGRSENFDDGFMTGYRPCGDGMLEPGEECDDGNRTSGDGCDLNCTVSRCGNGFVGGDEECDDGNTIPDDGCEPDCRRTPVMCAGGGGIVDGRLVIHNAGPPTGDESLTLTGTLAHEGPLAAALTGAQLVLGDADGTALLDLSARTHPVPPGARGAGCEAGDGWRTLAGRLVYANDSSALDAACTPGSALGLRRLVLDPMGSGHDVRFRARFAHAAISPADVVTVRLVLGGPTASRDGDCAEHTFACRRTSGGSTIICR